MNEASTRRRSGQGQARDCGALASRSDVASEVMPLSLGKTLLVFAALLLSGCSGGGGGTTSALAGSQMGGALQGSPLALTASVTTFAGTGSIGAVDAAGSAASFNYPWGITTEGTNLYVADSYNHRIRQISIVDGQVTTLAGSGTPGSVDATGTTASFNLPYGITTDGASLYVADAWNQKIRRIVIATGVVTTLAGSGNLGTVDGTGASASFFYPWGITTDGTRLYVADTQGNKIRQIVISTAAVTTLAGSGAFEPFVDATGAAASFHHPWGITTDGTHLYVADTFNNRIRQIVISTGAVTTLAGSGEYLPSADGIGTAARINWPAGITTDGTSLFVTEYGSHKIRKIVIATGVVTTLAGSGSPGSVDGPGTAASFNYPAGITTDGIHLYVQDSANHKTRRIR